MRVLDRKGDIFATMTPLKGLTFVYNEIFLNRKNDPEVWYEFIDWSDNPYLDDEEVQMLEGCMDERALQSRKYGRFGASEGLVYPEFDESVHVIQPFPVPKEWYDNVSIDPGLNNPLSCHFYATDGDGVVYVIAEHYEQGKSVSYHAQKIKEIADRLGWHRDSKGRLCALIDSAANQRTLASSKSVAELFYDEGILVNTRVNKDVFSGINRVKDYLRPLSSPNRPKLFIFASCVEMIRELKGYWWGEGDNPRKVNDHSCDELRYMIMSRPEPYVEKKTDSEISLDKARLIRKLGRRSR
jgi:hypothetical protein